MSLNYIFFNHTHYINKLSLLLQLLPNIVILVFNMLFSWFSSFIFSILNDYFFYISCTLINYKLVYFCC